MIFILYKLWYLFNVKRGFKLLFQKKIIYIHIYALNLSIKYFNTIILILKKFVIKFKLRLFRERYKSKCQRFLLRQLNLRFAIFRYMYRKYYMLKHYSLNELPHFLSYYYYTNYYKYIDLTYAALMSIYIMMLFVITIFSGFMYVVLFSISSDKYFYNLNAWITI